MGKSLVQSAKIDKISIWMHGNETLIARHEVGELECERLNFISDPNSNLLPLFPPSNTAQS